MFFFDYFQLIVIALVISIIVSKAAHLRFRRKVNAIVAGRDSRGVERVLELAAFAGLIFWMSEIISYAFHGQSEILPTALHHRLFDLYTIKIAGVALIADGLIVFIFAF